MRIGLAILVLCAACSKQAPSETSSHPITAAPPIAPNEPAEPGVPDPAPSDDVQRIDPSKAPSFIAYQDKFILVMQNWVARSKEINKNSAQGKYQGVIGTARGYKDFRDITGTYSDELDAARKATGLSENEIDALTEIGLIVAARDEARKTGIAKQLADMEKQVAALPEAERAEGQKSLDEFRTLQANVVDLKEMRDKYGDPIVDAMLKQEADLKRQRAEFTKLQ